MQIVVKIQSIYGKDCIYPVCENAQAFADIAKQKTLNNSIPLIKKLGYEIKVQSQEL